MKQRNTEKVTFLVEGERTLPKARLRFLLPGEKNATQVESTWDLEDTAEQRKGPKRRSFNWRKEAIPWNSTSHQACCRYCSILKAILKN